jgi:signal transduction histidine kinase
MHFSKTSFWAGGTWALKNAFAQMLLMLAIFGNAQAVEPAVFIPQGDEKQDLQEYMTVAQEPAGQMTIEDVAKGQLKGFRPATELKWAGIKDDVYWVRLTVDFKGYSESNSFLMLDPQPLGRVDLFYPNEKGGFNQATISAGQSLKDRNVSVRSLLLRLPTPKKVTPIYVRFEQRSQPMLLHLSWVSNRVAVEEVTAEQFRQGLLFGAFIILVIHNIFVLSRTYEWAHFLYAAYLVSFCAVLAMVTGIATKVGFFESSARSFTIINAAVICFGLGFVRKMLGLAEHARQMNKIISWVQLASVGSAVAALVGATRAGFLSTAGLVPVALLVIWLASVYRWRQGYPPARFNVVGIGVHAIASTAYVLQIMQIIPGAIITIVWVELGAIFEALLFSFALAQRLRSAEDEAKRRLKEKSKALEAEHAARAEAQRAAREVAEALEASRKAEKAKNEFLSMISHELRTPIGVIVAELEAEKSKRTGQERREGYKLIRWAVRSMESQIRDLFVLSIGEEDHLEMRSQPFEVRELIDEVIGAVTGTAELKGIRMVARGPDPLFVYADPRRVEQVLLNLIENAVKYTHNGVVTVEYSLTEKGTSNEGGELRVAVNDTGEGIATEHLGNLFLPFKRFGSINRERNSYGIGLAVVQTLLRHLGGTVNVSSELGKGSTFTVNLPVVVYHEKSNADEALQDSIQMLIVDDRQEVLDSLAKTAKSLEFHVDTARSASIAGNMLAAKVYDVVLIDLDMPGKNGYELASETRRGDGENSGTRLVAMSAGTPEAARLDLSSNLWPFDAFLQKPIHGEDMRFVVENRTAPSHKGA